jgi:hypothetical protein
MSKHVWLVKKFGVDTLYIGYEAFEHARLEGMEYPRAYRFAGYFIETVRQATWSSIKVVMSAAASRGFKYEVGRNRKNYETAGRKLVADYLSALLKTMLPDTELESLLEGIETGAESEGPLYDWLTEREQLDLIMYRAVEEVHAST